MKLDAWIRQDHPLAERLRVVERLSQSLNAVHDRGEFLVALDPTRVEIAGDFRCDLSGAERGSPEPGYAAPERIEGGPPSPAADVYSTGAIAWEVARRPPVRRAAGPARGRCTGLASRARERGHGVPGALASVAPEGPDLPRPARGRPAEGHAKGAGAGRRGLACALAQRPRPAHAAAAVVPQPPASPDRGVAGARRRGPEPLVDPAAGIRMAYPRPERWPRARPSPPRLPRLRHPARRRRRRPWPSRRPPGPRWRSRRPRSRRPPRPRRRHRCRPRRRPPRQRRSRHPHRGPRRRRHLLHRRRSRPPSFRLRPPRSPRRNPPSRPSSPRSPRCRSVALAGPCSTCAAPGCGPTCTLESCPCARRRGGYPWRGRSG